jgi:EAL domain-containing protein (putative c-di-GMP-specific phosphodiesterase class I)
LAPEYLEIELTESLLIENTERASAIVEGLQAMGLTVSIDDFGAGYSSLDYLKRFPIGCLKIDRSFVRDIARSAKDAAIVETIATLAASLKIDLVAEGVEGVEQVNFLRARQCTELQGDYFSPPVPADAVPQLVERFARSLVGLPAAA